MKFLVACGLLLGGSAYAMTLETARYIVEIEQNCPEGYVTCDDVSYVATRKSNGDSITLVGVTVHTYAADGTPAQFLGYRFDNGNITYMVTDDGRLQVYRNENELLLDEQGEWDY